MMQEQKRPKNLIQMRQWNWPKARIENKNTVTRKLLMPFKATYSSAFHARQLSLNNWNADQKFIEGSHNTQHVEMNAVSSEVAFAKMSVLKFNI
jgi:hypothetical protein